MSFPNISLNILAVDHSNDLIGFLESTYKLYYMYDMCTGIYGCTGVLDKTTNKLRTLTQEEEYIKEQIKPTIRQQMGILLDKIFRPKQDMLKTEHQSESICL